MKMRRLSSEIGMACVSELRDMAKGSGPHTPQKTWARKILCNAVGDDQRKSRVLARTHGMFRACWKQPGRQKGSVEISDAEMFERLAPQCTESSRMHSKLAKPIVTLSLSKRRSVVACAVPLKKSQLCKRLQKCRLVVARGSCTKRPLRCMLCMEVGRPQALAKSGEQPHCIDRLHLPRLLRRLEEQSRR